jgi:23S rRNA (pseudouridine1915-N3)-methyltransferase
VIGDSDGMGEDVKAECDLRLSFSKMTFPHQLMRVILLEQIYRAFTIINNGKYHK